MTLPRTNFAHSFLAHRAKRRGRPAAAFGAENAKPGAAAWKYR